MTASTNPVAIIGSGPYGLATAAHLSAAGVEARIFGEPMGFWQQMPAGMCLRSAWDASHIAGPAGSLTLDEYQVSAGIQLPLPLPLDEFVRYGLWFQGRAAPEVERRRISSVDADPAGFRLALEDGEVVRARRVVVAAGIAPFAWRAPQFEGLPSDLASHSGEHRDFGRFAGNRVVVVGSGQSALECAALLHEAGATVEIVARARRVHFLRRSTVHKYIGSLDRLAYPRADVGPPGLNWIVSSPRLFKSLPAGWQGPVARRSIRPAGGAWLRPRLEAVPITLSRNVASADVVNGRVRLALDDGSERMVDHVLVATGYRVDVERYPFLSDGVFHALRRAGGYPLLGAGFESSIPGLHFVGAPAAASFGPMMRFVSGTNFTARELTGHVRIGSSAMGRRTAISAVG